MPIFAPRKKHRTYSPNDDETWKYLLLIDLIAFYRIITISWKWKRHYWLAVIKTVKECNNNRNDATSALDLLCRTQWACSQLLVQITLD